MDLGLLPAFRSGVKKKRAGKAGEKKPHVELRALEQELDRAYARMRERARYEWSLRQSQKNDPADATVSVRVSAASAPPPEPAAKTKQAPHLLLAKGAKARRKISSSTRRRR